MDARRRPRVPGRRAALVGVVGGLLALILAGAPAGATEPGPAYPPGAGATDVVVAGADGEPGPPDGGGARGDAGRSARDESDGGAPGPDGSDAGADDAHADDPDASDADESDGAGDAEAGDEAAAPGPASNQGAPDGEGGRGPGPVLIVVLTAVVLGGGVVAIARRI